ncbi:N-acetyltransferase family protein [Chitinimonas sp.]|uniref:GNAT family N-acetyltransferase n=1 Tax=Chitinimonas sp. TaxID=1934313 RepID=UPI0035B02E8B
MSAHGNAVTLQAFDASAVPALQAIYNPSWPSGTAPDLACDLVDHGRAGGQQVAIAWRNGMAVGCVAWVTLGIASGGPCFGAPLVASDGDVADLLIARLIAEASSAGARQLRVSVWAGEGAKAQALQRAGFHYDMEWLHFGLPTAVAAPVDFAALGLHPIDEADIDWPRFQQLYAETFREVPNAVVGDAEHLKHDCAGASWEVSRILADATGRYVAFADFEADGTAALGVAADWRGRGVANALYAHASSALAARGVGMLRARVASSNAASMRLHQKLGFNEIMPRGAVYGLTL